MYIRREKKENGACSVEIKSVSLVSTSFLERNRLLVYKKYKGVEKLVVRWSSCSRSIDDDLDDDD